MVGWLLVIHLEVRDWLHDVRKADRQTAALIGQAIQHVIEGRGPDEGARWSTGSRAAACTT